MDNSVGKIAISSEYGDCLALNVRLLLALVLIPLTACSSTDERTSGTYGIEARLQGDPSIERTWIEPSHRKIATLASGDEYTLFNPAESWILGDDRIYIWDGGDFKLKAFTPNGALVETYGRGKGDGPGEIEVYRDIGLVRDSLYVLDSQNRRVSFFGRGGRFGRSTQYREGITNIAWAGDSIRYELFRVFGKPLFLRILDLSSGHRTTVSNLLSVNLRSIVFDGVLLVSKRKAIHVPLYFPLLLTFTPGDTTATAHPTPDYGEVPVPESRGSVQQGVIRPPSNSLHVDPTLHKGVLSIQIDSSKDSIAFDLYDAQTMEYMHTVRLPITRSNAKYAYGRGLLVAEQDTTMDVYRVEHPEQ